MNSETVLGEDPKSLALTLGYGRKRVQTFDEFISEITCENSLCFLVIKSSQKTKKVFDPRTQRYEFLPMFFVEEKTIKKEDAEQEWCSGEFFYLDNAINNISLIKGL